MSNTKHSQQSNDRTTPWILVGVAALVVGVLAIVATTFRTDGTDPQAQQVEADARQVALASEHAPTQGNPDAKVHIVEFLDPACETCAAFYPMVKNWMAEVPDDIRLSIRHVAFHEGAEHAVKVLEASRKQDKYWETLETLLKSQRQWVQHHVVQPDKILPAIAGVGLDMEQLEADMNSVDVMQRMERDKNDSILLKVSKTPEYFVNGRPLPSFGQRQLADLVREELQK
jgi:protein-disulfide isomerase